MIKKHELRKVKHKKNRTLVWHQKELEMEVSLSISFDTSVMCRVSVQGVESLWGVCRFIPADWGS